jgi:hypothetical protein
VANSSVTASAEESVRAPRMYHWNGSRYMTRRSCGAVGDQVEETHETESCDGLTPAITANPPPSALGGAVPRGRARPHRQPEALIDGDHSIETSNSSPRTLRMVLTQLARSFPRGMIPSQAW